MDVPLTPASATSLDPLPFPLFTSIYTPQSPGTTALLAQAPPAPGHGLRVPGALQQGLCGLQDCSADRRQRAGRT